MYFFLLLLIFMFLYITKLAKACKHFYFIIFNIFLLLCIILLAEENAFILFYELCILKI